MDATDLPYPAYGQDIPDVTLPAPLKGEEISVRQFDTDVVMTFFYSHCQTVCPRLVGALKNIQTRALEDGYSENVTFLAITFDPERDTTARLRDYAKNMNINREPDNWYFLRPESVSRAKSIVGETFGVGFERTHPDDMDMYMFNHFSLIILANRDSVVERTYVDNRPVWQDIYDHFVALRKQEG